MLYSAKVMDHFMNPRNVGAMEDADGVGQVGSARCGDSMKIYLKIEDGIITKATFETFGCGSAIASSSMATVLITGKPLSQALALTNEAVDEALDGLPEKKQGTGRMGGYYQCRVCLFRDDLFLLGQQQRWEFKGKYRLHL